MRRDYGHEAGEVFELTALTLLWTTSWFSVWGRAGVGAVAWGLLVLDLSMPFAHNGGSPRGEARRPWPPRSARDMHLATLELTNDASPQEIRAAWSRLVKLHHPDSTGNSTADRFQEVHGAYRALGSPGAPRAFAA